MQSQHQDKLSEIIDFFGKKTHFGMLFLKMVKLVKKEKNNLVTLFKKYKKAKVLVKKTAQNVRANLNLNISDKQIERLIWMILLVPHGGLKEKDKTKHVPEFGRLKLTPLLSAFCHIFNRLLAEMGRDDKDIASRRKHYLDILVDVVKKTEEYIKPSEECNAGVYNFYRKIQHHVFYPNFALGIIAYFNWKLSHDFDREIGERVKLLKKLENIKDSPVKRGKNKTNKTKKDIEKIEARLNKFLPFWEVLAEPMSVIKDGLEGMENSESEVEEWTPKEFIECLEEHQFEKGNQTSTINRKIKDFYIFRWATKRHKTIWGKIEKTEKEDIRETSEETGTDEDILLSISGHDITTKKKDYRHKIITENVAAQQRCGALVRLKYNWDNWRRISVDRLCAFVGFLRQKSSRDVTYKDLIYVFIESLLTGASPKHISETNNEPDEPTKGKPIGLYVTLNKMRETSGYGSNADSINGGIGDAGNQASRLRKALKDFNKINPQFSFSYSQIAYTGRARLIDTAKMSSFDVAHCCGAALSGMRSSLYYIQPKHIVKKLHRANSGFLSDIIKLINKSDNIRLGFVKKNLALIKSSLVCWIAAKNQLSQKFRIRQNIMKKRKCKIHTLPKRDYGNIFNRLKKNLGEAKKNGNIEDEIICVESIIIYFMFSFLMLRPAEMQRTSRGSISFKMRCLFVAGKGNRAYKESRILPLPETIISILDRYKVYIKGKESSVYTRKKKISDFFTHINKALSYLLSVMIQINNDYELYSFRRTGGTEIYYNYLNGRPFEYWQAIMGHSQVGFEHWGPFSRMDFRVMRDILENHSKSQKFKNQAAELLKLI